MKNVNAKISGVMYIKDPRDIDTITNLKKENAELKLKIKEFNTSKISKDRAERLQRMEAKALSIFRALLNFRVNHRKMTLDEIQKTLYGISGNMWRLAELFPYSRWREIKKQLEQKDSK